MKFDELEKTWEAFGKKDPLWAILSVDQKKNNKWELNEFFETGNREVDYTMALARKRYTGFKTERALDFGCGVGRLTSKLGDYFLEAHGVDISSEMIDRANLYVKSRKPNCFFHVNKKDDLTLFPDNHFDFINTLIVLQHMEPTYAISYIKEFLRILRIDGMLVFQLPDQAEHRVPFDEKGEPIMEMFGIRKESVIELLEANCGKVLDVMEASYCGPNLKSYRYFVRKVAPTAPAPRPPGKYEGTVDKADCSIITGWVCDLDQRDHSILIDILDGPAVVASIIAGDFRADLKQAGFGDGKHAFILPTPAVLKDGKPHSISAKVTATGWVLHGSPVTLTCQP